MSKPTRGASVDSGGLGVVGRLRSVWSFMFQDARGELAGCTDSDWAGCRKTARSASGGAILRRRHALKTWSATQKNVTLSSGEAELVAMVKMSCEMFGMTLLASEWGLAMKGHYNCQLECSVGDCEEKRKRKDETCQDWDFLDSREK